MASQHAVGKCRQAGTHGLKLAGNELDRKILADIAYRQPDTFKALAQEAQKALAKSPAKSKAESKAKESAKA